MSDSRQLYAALLRIKNDPEFAPVKEWLQTMRDNSRDRLETIVDNHQTEQGKAQILKRILETIEDSHKYMDKFK